MDRDLSQAVEILKDKFSFVSLRTIPRDTEKATFFCVDNELVYLHFFNDFGPLNMGQLYRFCNILKGKLADAKNRHVYLYSSFDAQKRANCAFLIGGFLVMVMDYTPDEAFSPFSNIRPSFTSFRDASYGASTFPLTLIECFKGLWKGKKNKWVDFNTFNLTEYEYYERVENGDMNWIIPGKFLAFSGPVSASTEMNGIRTLTPDFYVPIFRKLGITTIVRLNKKCYDRKRFLDSGFKHHDLYFPDGSCPSEMILRKFLEIAESEPGAIAVHCKAGLGRTGTLIGCYMMKYYKMTATETIGWIRVCRPGSIIGPQQHFLQEMQQSLWKQGDLMQKMSGTTFSTSSGSLSGTQSTNSALSGTDSDAEARGVRRGLQKLTVEPRATGNSTSPKPRPNVAAPKYGGSAPVTPDAQSAIPPVRPPASAVGNVRGYTYGGPTITPTMVSTYGASFGARSPQSPIGSSGVKPVKGRSRSAVVGRPKPS